AESGLGVSIYWRAAGRVGTCRWRDYCRVGCYSYVERSEIAPRVGGLAHEIMSRRRRRQHKAWGVSPRNLAQIHPKAREAGDSPTQRLDEDPTSCRSLRELGTVSHRHLGVSPRSCRRSHSEPAKWVTADTL